MRFDPVRDYVGALASGGRSVHSETADASTVYRGVRGVRRCEGQALEYRRVEHPQTVQPTGWSTLIITDGVHRGAHPLPP